MSGLLFLTTEDFSIQDGTKGPILCNGIPGFSLILFYSTQCGHCQDLIPIFKRLPGTIGGCQFGMINVSSNKKVVRMSNKTIAPVTYVPYIILYINGKPFMKYNGPHTSVQLKNFVIEVANKVQNKQQFSKKNVNPDENNRGLPEYSIGIPWNPKLVCYLDFENAYKE